MNTGKRANRAGNQLAEFIENLLQDYRYVKITPIRFFALCSLEQPIYTKECHTGKKLTMQNTRTKLKRWVEKTQDQWKTKSYQEISKTTNIPIGSISRYLAKVVCEVLNPERDPKGILPSKVKKIRNSKIYRKDRVLDIIKKHPKLDDRDLAFLAKCAPKSIKRLKKELETNRSQS